MKQTHPLKPVAAWVVATLILGLLLSALAAWRQAESNRRGASEALLAASERVAGQLMQRMQLYEYGVRGARGAVLVAGEHRINRALFRGYSETRDLDSEFRGARGFGFIRRVPRAAEQEYVQNVRSDGRPDFSISELSAHEGERFVIEQIEPVERNGPAVGLDIGSEANRRRAALAAMQTGEATITAPITLVQASGARQRSMLLLLPIFRPGRIPQNPQEREAAAFGWSYAPLSMEEVLSDFRVGDDDLTIAIRDVSDPQGAVPIFDSTVEQASAPTLLTRQLDRKVYGRRWQIELGADRHFVQRLGQLQPSTVFLAGLLASVLLAALVAAVRIGRERERAHAANQADLASRLMRENGERKESERRLQELSASLEQQVSERTSELEVARRDLQTVLDAVPSMIGYWDHDLVNRVANAAYHGWFGVPPGEMRGKRLRDLLSAEMYELSRPFIEAALRGEPQIFERSVPNAEGTGQRHLLARYLPDVVFGDVRGFYVIVHDITEITEGRRALVSERQRLNNIIEGTGAGTWEWNVRTGEVSVNERWAEIVGYGLEELQPTTIQTCIALMHPDDQDRNATLLKRHFKGDIDHYACEFRLRHKTGRWVWIAARGRLFTRTSDGMPERMYGTHLDITAIKTAEGERIRMANLLASVLRAATEIAVIATDVDGTISIFNEGAEQLLGYSAQELVGVATPAVFHLPSEISARGDELGTRYGRPVEGFRVFVHEPELLGSETREWTYVRKDGTHVPVSLVVTTIRGDDGAVAGFLGMAHDITERLRAESDLREAKTAAEAANAAKSMFLANMSHEIRSPMNAVIGVAYLLETTPLDDDQRRLLAKLQIAGRSLLGIINDVLDLAKIEAGEMSVEMAAFSPAEVLSELAQLFMPQAEAKGIALEVRGQEALPPRMLGDALRLRQILVNLISNAIKFTEQGRVIVQVRAEDGEDEPRTLRWSVRDTGCGIEPGAAQRLFEPFAQADASTTRRFGGTGLGLSIVRQLVAVMQGEVGVESTLGEGSEFWVRLPFVPAEDGARSSGDRGQDLHVVVVDDDEDDRRVLVDLCHSLGWRATALASGEQLVAHFRSVASGLQPQPDALLVDWQMPGMSGLQALARVADEAKPRPLPASLIVSARERSEIGALDGTHLVDQILGKPLEASTLFNAVNNSVARHTGNAERVARSTRIEAVDARWLAGLHILVVDDSDINLEVAQRLLQREGAVVQTAVNGQDAVDRLRAEPERFDVVLMDVQMPVMDGYEATRRLRGELGLSRLPVLAVTAGALGEERRRAEEAGMTAFLTKPLDPPVLVRAIRQAVEHRRGQALELASATKASEAPLNWPAIEGIHGADVARRLGNDADLFLRLLGRLLREFGAPESASIDDAATDARRQLSIERMHKLRGSSGLLGAGDVHRLAGEAETALRAGDDHEKTQRLLEALAQALARLAAASEPALAAQRPQVSQASRADATGPGADSPSGGDLESLSILLREQDLAAVELFQRMVPALMTTWGPAAVDRMRQAIDDLDFAAALVMISQATESDVAR